MAGCVLLLVIGVASLAYTPFAWSRGSAMAAAGVCPEWRAPAVDPGGCLVEVPGRIDARFSRGEWRFVPSVTGVRNAYVRFADDRPDTSTWPPALARLLSGAPATAQYWGREPVAFVVDGTRVLTTSFGTTYVPVGTWFGVMGLSFALAGLPGLLGRRPGRVTLGLIGSGIGALVNLVVESTSPHSWTHEGVIWVAAVVAAAALPARLVSHWADLVEAQGWD